MSSLELSEDEESQLFFHSVESRFGRTGESEMAGGRTGNLTSSAFRLLSSFPLDWLSSFAALVFLAHARLPLDLTSHIQNDYPGRARTWQLTRTGAEAST